MALTDPYRQGKGREIAGDGASMGEGDVAEREMWWSPTEYMSAQYVQNQMQNDIITFLWYRLSDCPMADSLTWLTVNKCVYWLLWRLAAVYV